MSYSAEKKHKIKKIAFVYDAVFPFIKGGAEKRIFEVGKRLAVLGYDIHLYGMKSWDGDNVIQYQGMTLHGICKKMPLYTQSGRRSIFQAIFFGVSCFKLIKEDFDVIDCCGFPYFSLFPTYFISKLKRKVFYSTWHEVWGFNYWKQYLGLLGIVGFLVERIAVHLPDVIIASSDATLESIDKKLGRKKNVFTIVNGIDINLINKSISNAQHSDIIYTGRLVEHKNVQLLLEVFAKIVSERPSLLLRIIGDGPEKSALEQFVLNNDLTKNVFFHGFVENDSEVYSLLHNSKVLVLPSIREGFGIVVIESNACGTPVITVDHPNNAAKDLIVDGVNGYLAELTVDSMQSTICKVLDTHDSLNPKKYTDTYDWDVIVQSFVDNLNIFHV